MTEKEEVLFMKIRLLELASEKWKLTREDAANVFDKNDVYSFISDLYDEFHVQGDDANLAEIDTWLRTKGVRV